MKNLVGVIWNEHCVHLENCEVVFEGAENDGIQPAFFIKFGEENAKNVLMVTGITGGYKINNVTGIWDIVDGKSKYIKEK